MPRLPELKSNKSIDTDVLSAGLARLPAAGHLRRYEGMALSSSSGKTFRPRTARVRCLGVPIGSLFWGWHGRRPCRPRSKLVCAGRSARAVAPASLAQVVGAPLSGEQSFWAAANGLGAKVAFKPTWSAQPESMPPYSFQHRRASAKASHNRSVNADAQSGFAAAPRLSLAAGYVRR